MIFPYCVNTLDGTCTNVAETKQFGSAGFAITDDQAWSTSQSSSQSACVSRSPQNSIYCRSFPTTAREPEYFAGSWKTCKTGDIKRVCTDRTLVLWPCFASIEPCQRPLHGIDIFVTKQTLGPKETAVILLASTVSNQRKWRTNHLHA